MSKSKKEISFEEAVVKLESIVEKLEAGKVPLDDTLALFEEGVKLSRFCNEKLETIERKIEILTKEKDENGLPATKKFDEDSL